MATLMMVMMVTMTMMLAMMIMTVMVHNATLDNYVPQPALEIVIKRYRPPAAAAPRQLPSPQQQPQYTPPPVAMAPVSVLDFYEDDDGASPLSFIALSWSSA